VAGQDRRHVFRVQVALHHRLDQVAQRRRDHRSGPEHQADPGVAVQQQDNPERAARQTQDHRPGESLPGFLRTDRRDHQMLAEQDASEVAAGVTADGQDEEEQHPVRAARLGEHESHEPRHERHVAEREDPGRDVTDISVGPTGQPPHENRYDRESKRGDQRARPGVVRQEQHQEPAGHDRDERHGDLPCAERGTEFPERDSDEESNQHQERRLDGEQREYCQTPEAEPDGDGDGQVPASIDRPALAHTSSSSASLCLSSSSTWVT